MTVHPAPKRHHYVPELIQRNFVDSNGKIHFYREGSSKDVLCTNPDNLFVEQHLYSSIDENDNKDARLEIWFSRLESRIAVIFNELIREARQDRVHRLSDEEKGYWALYMYSQWRRVPESHRAIVNKEKIREMREQILDDLLVRFPHKDQEIARIRKSEVTEKLVQNTRVGSLSRSTGRVEQLLYERPIVVCRIRRGNMSFITGSFPIIKLGNQDLEAPDSELWLPISSVVAVGIGKPADEDKIIWMDRPEGVRHMNLCILKQSSIIAGRSPLLLRSLINAR